jgi:hypothetical protein
VYSFRKRAAPMIIKFREVNIVALVGGLDSFCVSNATTRRPCLQIFIILSYDVTIFFTCHKRALTA